MDTDIITDVPEEECWELLGGREFGRLAFHLLNEVHIVPLNYAVHDRRIIFRTAEGSKLLALTMNDDVAFEVDETDSSDVAWSVVMRGRARHLSGDEALVAEQLPLRPWVPTAKFNVVAIEVDEINGRRFRLDRPWLHMRPHAEN